MCCAVLHQQFGLEAISEHDQHIQDHVLLATLSLFMLRLLMLHNMQLNFTTMQGCQYATMSPL